MTYDKAMRIIVDYDTHTWDEVRGAASYIMKKSQSFADIYAAKRALVNYTT